MCKYRKKGRENIEIGSGLVLTSMSTRMALSTVDNTLVVALDCLWYSAKGFSMLHIQI